MLKWHVSCKGIIIDSTTSTDSVAKRKFNFDITELSVEYLCNDVDTGLHGARTK